MNQSALQSPEGPPQKQNQVNPTQLGILIVCAILAVTALLFPPWSRSGGKFGGYHFISFSPCGSCAINSSFLFIEIAGLALTTWVLFVAARNAKSNLMGGLTIAIGCLVAVSLIGWFLWSDRYTSTEELNQGKWVSFRTNRFTGAREVFSDQKGWITEAERKADEKAEADQKLAEDERMRNDLKQISIDSWNDADYLQVYNPTHWQLAYGTQLTVEFYNQGKLLKIAEQELQIKPGINKIWVMDARDLLDQMPLIEKLKIRATTLQAVGRDGTTMELEPPFVFESQRVCREYKTNKRDSGDEDDPYLSVVNTQIVCKSN